MDRRYPPKRTRKQSKRDSKIAERVIYLTDVLGDEEQALSFFMENQWRLSDSCYWQILRSLWIACGSQENIKDFKVLFNRKRSFQFHFMTPSDEATLKKLPAEIELYRAITGDDDCGISWTSSLEVAERFAEAQCRQIIKKVFKKKDIFAFLNSRNEHEFIIWGGE
ncbi:hypothetical protein [Wohlfahrtiimonas chitiniclastica]|uniref:hypothetical protein n=1 Tax=Wohlfahrtiimonas chitiniclastica TaxID=400946 RepID=UPI001BD1AC69|nr:hypothetical protein [Wohlfahrtiimonas chitiniclastica]MBS7836460.1 hypothetical protein [Wohlfahrtiimonas chitiniclastica]